MENETHKWWILAAMGGVLGLIVLDETVLGVALPTIRHDLGMSQVTSHWVINSYLLVLAGCVVAGGKMGDVFGLKHVFLAAAAVFGLGSLASGFAPDSTWLITTRTIQGLGAAIILPVSMAMITLVFPPEERALATGIYVGTGGIFIALGPLIGGFFTETFSWRWIFWVNLPVVVFVELVMVALWRNPPQAGKPPPIDLYGLVTMVIGLSALIFTLMQGPVWGWTTPPTVALLAIGVIFVVIFLRGESHTELPLIEIDLFRNTNFTVCNLVLFTGQCTKISVTVFLAMYLQDELGYSPLAAGLALLPAVVPLPFSSVLAGRLAGWYGARWPILTGLGLQATALAWIGVAAAFASYGAIIPALVIWGSSLPLLFAPPTAAIMSSVPASKQGQAAGIGRGAQFIGGTIDVAVAGAILTSSGNYPLVFLLPAALTLALLVLAWIYIVSPKAAVPDRSGGRCTHIPGS